MRQNNPGSITRVCARCGKENFSFASFCIACGEPLDTHDDPLPDARPTRSSDDLSSKTTPHVAPQARPGARWKKWESIAGLALLLLTLGYALFNWLQTNTQASAYHQGLSAEQQKDWDKAASSFQQAGGLQDASLHLAEASSKIKERNNLYSAGIAAATQKDWGAAISNFDGVQAVQPGYKDSLGRLNEAREQAFRRGLEGLIYLVDDGPTPGLYVRDANGRDLLLPGSDRHSTVRAISPDSNVFVYDRPSKETDYFWPPLKHFGAGPDTFGPDKSDRIPVLARLDGPGQLTISLLPRLDPTGTGIFSRHGLWWFSTQPGLDYYGYETYYDADYLDPGAKVTRVSDIANGRRVLAVYAPGEQVIIAETSGESNSTGRQTNIYLADAQGHNETWLDRTGGDVLQASVSNDGRRLLYISQQNGTSISRTVWLAPLDVGTAYGIESRLSRQLESLTWSGLEMMNARLTAAFIPSDDTSKLQKVIIDRVEGSIETVSVHNLENFGATIVWQGKPAGLYGRSMSGFSNSGELLASRRQQDDGSVLEMLGLGPRTGIRSITGLPSSPNQIVKVQFAPLDNYAVISVQNPDGISRGIAQLMYAAHIKDDGTLDESSVKRIAEANLPYESDLAPVTMPERGFQLAYVTPGHELHVVFFSGNGDTKLGDNVGAVWSLRSRSDLSWWR